MPKTKYYWVLIDQYNRYAAFSHDVSFLFPTKELSSAHLFKQKRSATKWADKTNKEQNSNIEFTVARAIITIVEESKQNATNKL